MKTWDQFKTAVNELLTVDGRRAGMVRPIEQWTRQAVIDIQSHVPELCLGHTTTYILDDLTANSFCLTGELPDEVKITEVWQSKIGTSGARLPFSPYDWEQRYDLKAGNVPTGTYLIAINPKGGEFWMYPPLDEEHQLEITYDGRKIDFDDEDEVPFPEDMEQVVADWVSAQIARRVNQDLAMHQSYMNSFMLGRTRLYIDAKDKARIKNIKSSPMPELNIPDQEED